MATPTYTAAPISAGEKGQQWEQAFIARDAAFLLEPNVTFLLGACWPWACSTESTALREKANISNVEEHVLRRPRRRSWTDSAIIDRPLHRSSIVVAAISDRSRQRPPAGDQRSPSPSFIPCG